MANQQRMKKIIELFAYSDQMIFQETLMSRFDISKRTLQNDLAEINELFTDVGLPRITYSSVAGYQVREQQREFLLNREKEVTEKKDFYPVNERLLRILFLTMFSSEKIISNKIMEYNLVTKNTTLNDIKTLKQEMRADNIDLLYNHDVGNYFVGNESDVRNFFLKKLFVQFSARLTEVMTLMNNTLDAPIFNEDAIEKNRKQLLIAEEKLSVRYTDDMLEKLSIVLLVVQLRIKRNSLVGKIEQKKSQIHIYDYYNVSQEMLKKHSSKVLTSTAGHFEAVYFEMFLISGNKTKEKLRFNEHLNEAVDQMISEYERLSKTSFGDERINLFDDLLSHLYPAFYRIVFNLEWINPNTIDIKNKYQKEYKLTQQSVIVFEEMIAEKVPENEIMYLTIIFGGYTYRKQQHVLNTVLIICPHGITSSKLIENQLKSFLPDNTMIKQSVSVREYKEKDLHADLIVSTVPLKTEMVNFILVDKEINDEQKNSILNFFKIIDNTQYSEQEIANQILSLAENHGVANKQFEKELKTILATTQPENLVTRPLGLDEIIEKASIIFNSTPLSWKEAITLSAQPLLKKGIISSNYIQAMIDSVVEWGPYIIIAPGIAFPHAFPEDGAFGVGCSILYNAEPISFSNNKEHDVQLIVVITSNDGFSHIKSLSELTYLLTYHHLSDKISQMKSSHEIYSLIKKCMKDGENDSEVQNASN